MENVLRLFGEESTKWFETVFKEPTRIQKEAWPFIAEGKHVLVSAPTGTGKTLSAFFVFLDRMKKQAEEAFFIKLFG